MMLCRRLLILFFVMTASPLRAVSVDGGSSGGVMIFPNSQYYYYMAGFWGGGSSDDGQIRLRLWHFSRPEYRAQGYEDKDSATFALIGRDVWKRDDTRLTAWGGRARVSGYIRDGLGEQERRYLLWGYPFGLEISTGWDLFRISLAHFTCISIDGERQFRVFVAWPFSYFTFNIGMDV
ncbi:MAG: hypothetical protein H6618_04035 [Deltaproteobacteria bacterium]|nr:hypothetical protein [Deltaproteobacteria bacterium]